MGGRCWLIPAFIGLPWEHYIQVEVLQGGYTLITCSGKDVAYEWQFDVEGNYVGKGASTKEVKLDYVLPIPVNLP